MMHRLIERYIRVMKYLLWWYGDFDYLEGSFPRRFFKVYLKYRWFLSVIFFIVTCIGLHSREFMGLYDGTFVYGPLIFEMAIMVSIITFSGHDQGVLTMKLNNFLTVNDEAWMNTIREEYTVPLWRNIRFYTMYVTSAFSGYMMIPLVLDTVLHFGFNYLETPLVLPSPLTPFIGEDTKWNLKFYFIILVNIWSFVELAFLFLAPIINFATMSNYVLVEMRIFRERIKMLVLNGISQEDINVQMKDVIKSHDNLLELNRNLRAVFGLPCAFSALFLSLAITLNLFTALTTDDIVVSITYGSGIFLHIFTALSFCSLGQRLENESDEIFQALCNLPWFECSPNVRKDLNMIIRQARTPLIVDFHGRSAMNNKTFMQIIRSSYSYYTLLQSMTK